MRPGIVGHRGLACAINGSAVGPEAGNSLLEPFSFKLHAVADLGSPTGVGSQHSRASSGA